MSKPPKLTLLITEQLRKARVKRSDKDQMSQFMELMFPGIEFNELSLHRTTKHFKPDEDFITAIMGEHARHEQDKAGGKLRGKLFRRYKRDEKN